MGKSTISMAIFNSYVKIPERKRLLEKNSTSHHWSTVPRHQQHDSGENQQPNQARKLRYDNISNIHRGSSISKLDLAQSGPTKIGWNPMEP